jgi:hypothetical protein
MLGNAGSALSCPTAPHNDLPAIDSLMESTSSDLEILASTMPSIIISSDSTAACLSEDDPDWQIFHDVPVSGSLVYGNEEEVILNFKVLRKQLFSIRFPPDSCFMQILFHFFCKVCMINMNIFFA